MGDFMQDWDDYQRGLEYIQRRDLINTGNRNERFYAGHHWEGIDAGPMPELMLNLVERIGNYKISHIASNILTMHFSADNAVNYKKDDPARMEKLREAATLLTDFSKTTAKRLNMDTLNVQGLIDAYLSGDMIEFYYWEEKLVAGNGLKGDMAVELIDNVNFIPGDPSESRINDETGPLQPWIIIPFRRIVKNVKAIAKENGVSEDELEGIVPDDGYNDRAGDRARDETEAQDKDNGKCTMLLKLWVGDNGKIWARQSVKGLVVRPDWDTELTLYPIAKMSWKPRKNSCYGEPEASAVVPNNIAVNKMLAMCFYWTMINAFPKPIYDIQRITNWSNDVQVAIEVDGDITGAAQFLQPQGLPPSVLQLFDTIIQMTKDMAGANETALGDSSVTKTAAGIIALQKASAAPLAMIDSRFAQLFKDRGLIWRDFWMAKFRSPAELPEAAKRVLTVEREGQTEFVEFDAAEYDGAVFSLDIDVGASTQYSDIQAYTILMEWLDKDLITFKQCLERIQNFNIVPDVDGLMKDIDDTDANKQLLYMIMAFFVRSWPTALQAELEQIRQADEQKYEEAVKKLIMQQLSGGAGGQAAVGVQMGGGAEYGMSGM